MEIVGNSSVNDTGLGAAINPIDLRFLVEK